MHSRNTMPEVFFPLLKAFFLCDIIVLSSCDHMLALKAPIQANGFHGD